MAYLLTCQYDKFSLFFPSSSDKIHHRQEMEKVKANSSATLRSMEEFCQKFDHSVSGPMVGFVPLTVTSQKYYLVFFSSFLFHVQLIVVIIDDCARIFFKNWYKHVCLSPCIEVHSKILVFVSTTFGALHFCFLCNIKHIFTNINRN